MPIIPGYAENIPGTGFDYEVKGPTGLESALGILASTMQGAAEMKKAQMNQLTAAFPTLLAAKMASLAKPGTPGAVQYGGMPWTISEPGMDLEKLNQMALLQDRMQRLSGEPSIADVRPYVTSLIQSNPEFFINTEEMGEGGMPKTRTPEEQAEMMINLQYALMNALKKKKVKGMGDLVAERGTAIDKITKAGFTEAQLLQYAQYYTPAQLVSQLQAQGVDITEDEITAIIGGGETE